ncbi:glycoside hydrolase domain-containing protein [Actinomadura sp. 3N508]|uniref:glycoside hydrolase domain-containing protein n=1 Tax=Actinomadura sp. 3N508 TaxID=3375153 RepID=UPI0037B29A4A
MRRAVRSEAVRSSAVLSRAALFGGLAVLAAVPPVVAVVRTSAARPAPHQAAALTDGRARTGVPRVVGYRGLRLTVPAGWEVHDLERDPSRCVRYDRHAVYLGRPGPQPDCPARLVGRTEAIHLQPADRVRPAADGRASRTVVHGAQLATFDLPQTVDHEARLTVPEAGVTITGVYGTDPAALQRLLRHTRLTTTASAAGSRTTTPSTQATPSTPAIPAVPAVPSVPAVPGVPPVPAVPVAPPVPSMPAAAPVVRSVPSVPPEVSMPTEPSIPDGPFEPFEPDVPRGPDSASAPIVDRRPWVRGKGFDTCTAPSLKAMRAWRPSFKVTNIYIGGAARGCAQPNLTKRWVREVREMGYRITPTYVGLQAPCSSRPQRFSAKNAASQGAKSAVDAARKARALGIRKGAPIYYDMEAYKTNQPGCRAAVLRFVDNWVRKLKKAGYKPCLYSSVKSGIRDVGRAEGISRPVGVWFANWDGRAKVYGDPFIPDHWWNRHRRIKQYRGGHKERHGGVTINIDSNIVDGRVY